MRYVAAGVVLLVAAVSGCSSSDAAPAEVGPLASGSASAPATPSGGPKVPSSTDPATGAKTAAPTGEVSAAPQYPATVAGASAAAREYVQLIGRGFADANSQVLRARSAPGCEGCDALISAMDQAAEEGLRRRGGDYTVTSIATPPFEDGDVILLLTYTRGVSEIIDAASNVVDRAPAVPETTVQIRLIHGPDGWLTQGYRVV